MAWKLKSFLSRDVNFYENIFPFQKPSCEFFKKNLCLKQLNFLSQISFFMNYLLSLLIPLVIPMILLDCLVLHQV